MTDSEAFLLSLCVATSDLNYHVVAIAKRYDMSNYVHGNIVT